VEHYFPRGRLRFARDALRWERVARFGPRVRTRRAERATAIVLSFRRQRNIDVIARSILKCDVIGRLIVRNSNPDVEIGRWVSVRDPRLVVEDRGVNAGAVARFEIARREPAEFFYVRDDDLLLYPLQVAALVEALVEDPLAPHGLFGQRRRPAGGFEDGVQSVNGPIDVLNRAYALTRGHLDEFFRLLERLGMHAGGDRLAPDSIDRGDDMLLSFSGGAPPRCHDVGPLLDCPTQWLPGVAVWREGGFREYRERLYARLAALKSFA